MLIKKPFLICVMGLIIIGCIPRLRDIGRERKISIDPAPHWIKVIPRGYFVGMSSDCPQEADARQEALRNAQRAIIESLGVKLESVEIDKIVTTGSTKDILTTDVFNQVQINVIAKSILKVAAEEYYVEKWERITRTGVEYYYKAWAKVRFSELEYKLFIDEMVKETITLAKSLIQEATKLEKEGKDSSAIEKYTMALQSLKEIDGLSGVPVKYISEINKIEIETTDKLKNLRNRIAGRTKLIVFIEDKTSEGCGELVKNYILKSLENKNLTIIPKKIKKGTIEEMIQQAKNYGATILVYGTTEIEKLNHISYKLYTAHGRMMIKIVSIDDEKVVAVFNIPDDKFPDMRGFGTTAQDAIRDVFSFKKTEKIFEHIAEKIEKIIAP